MSTISKVFEDGVFRTDTSKFVDYPHVKIKSFRDAENRSSKRIFFFTWLLLFISGVAVVITIV